MQQIADRPRQRAKLPAALATMALALCASPSSAEQGGANLIAFVTLADSSAGVVRCGIFTQQGWLKDPVASATARVEGKKAVCPFRNVAPGTYGLSAFHDENNNGKLDTNFIGLPTEDYCASRDARGTFGPPSFDDAKFNYQGGVLRLSARLK